MSAGRTKRWSGSTTTPPLDGAGHIICERPRSTGRHASVYAYHDWFIANHPPIRIVAPA